MQASSVAPIVNAIREASSLGRLGIVRTTWNDASQFTILQNTIERVENLKRTALLSSAFPLCIP